MAPVNLPPPPSDAPAGTLPPAPQDPPTTEDLADCLRYANYARNLGVAGMIPDEDWVNSEIYRVKLFAVHIQQGIGQPALADTMAQLKNEITGLKAEFAGLKNEFNGRFGQLEESVQHVQQDVQHVQQDVRTMKANVNELSLHVYSQYNFHAPGQPNLQFKIIRFPDGGRRPDEPPHSLPLLYTVDAIRNLNDQQARQYHEGYQLGLLGQQVDMQRTIADIAQHIGVNPFTLGL